MKITDRRITISKLLLSDDDTKCMLDEILKPKTNQWWNDFYKDKSRKIPFLVNLPSENLVEYISADDIKIGTALDIGCGNGRNSYFLADKGFIVTGIDFSSESIKLARKENNHESIKFENCSFEDFDSQGVKYDLIYDGGCLHHIPPHRRYEYLNKVYELLKDDGKYGMEIFNESGGADLSDYEVYIERNMKGGIAYSEERLNIILRPFFDIIKFRKMKAITDGTAFGVDINWALLMQKSR